MPDVVSSEVYSAPAIFYTNTNIPSNKYMFFINEGLKYAGFKLIKFELIDNELFGNISYEFIDDETAQDKIYTTVLIGANGTLKSRMFQKLIEIFWALNDLKDQKAPSLSFKFILKYSLENSIYETSYGGTAKEETPLPSQGFRLIINGESQNDFTKIDLPSTIIASAIMITDRFPFPDQEKFPRYQYLGSRYRPQLSSTKTYIGRVVDFISKNIDSTAFIGGVKLIADEFFHTSNQPCVTFYTQNTTYFFKGNITPEKLFSYYEDIDKKYKDKTTAPPFKLNHYKSKIKDDPSLANEIVEFCNDLRNNNSLRSFYKSSSRAITFRLLDPSDVDKLRKNFYLLEHMRQLGMVYPPEIEFLKQHEDNLVGYSIMDSSSGEYNLLGSLIGLMASIQPNSLIFIDEPEISLHPNWQMKYLSFLRKLFADENYATCHILVATHSHFLISDLEGDHSSVIALTRDQDTNSLSAELLTGQDTYCWSPDDILYNIFNVTSSRNKFVAEDIAKILDTLSKGDAEKVNQIEKGTYDTLIHLQNTLKDMDPLKEVVKSILKKVN